MVYIDSRLVDTFKPCTVAYMCVCHDCTTNVQPFTILARMLSLPLTFSLSGVSGHTCSYTHLQMQVPGTMAAGTQALAHGYKGFKFYYLFMAID